MIEIKGYARLDYLETAHISEIVRAKDTKWFRLELADQYGSGVSVELHESQLQDLYDTIGDRLNVRW